jgi:hypothetical protein
VNKSELIKKAIELAGGVEGVAKEFNVGARAVRKWWQVSKVPTDRVYRLCEMGSFNVLPHQLNSNSFPKAPKHKLNYSPAS